MLVVSTHTHTYKHTHAHTHTRTDTQTHTQAHTQTHTSALTQAQLCIIITFKTYTLAMNHHNQDLLQINCMAIV